jgi:hypothetical protein
MKIAPGIDAADWKKLDLDAPNHPDWDRGISILEQRLRGRFTDVVEFLIADDETRAPADRRFGFAILALDCLVAETLEAFRQGLVDTRNKSKDLCVTFLSQRPAFKSFFDEALAKRFYYEFRCGIVHNAQVLGSGLVWSVGPLVRQDADRITVNRTAFHEALMREFAAYLNELREPSQSALRQHFRTKMNFVAEGQSQS